MSGSIWDSLEAHPAWQQIARDLTLLQKDKFRELVAVGLISTDPRVRGVAQDLSNVDYLMTYPARKRDEEAEREPKTDAD